MHPQPDQVTTQADQSVDGRHVDSVVHAATSIGMQGVDSPDSVDRSMVASPHRERQRTIEANARRRAQ